MTLLNRCLLLTAFFAFSASLASAQCKLDKDETDKFTNARMREVTHSIGQKAYHWEIVMKRTGDDYKLGMRIVWGINVNSPFSKDEPILIKLEDGQLITLKADEDAAAQQQIYGTQVITLYYPIATVDRDTYKKLKKSPIIAIRTRVGGKDVDLPKINSKQTDRIMTSAACILSNSQEN